jgi:hypothetical protein
MINMTRLLSRRMGVLNIRLERLVLANAIFWAHRFVPKRNSGAGLQQARAA